VDHLNVLFLTPLPGTRLWDKMQAEDRIALGAFPEDWQYYTLTFPVSRYKQLSLHDVMEEMIDCSRHFYSLPRILRRVWGNLSQLRNPLITLVGGLSFRSNIRLDEATFAKFGSLQGARYAR
jgi:radical SAM superfamily enzyme YgiQ (UPF0313 family)